MSEMIERGARALAKAQSGVDDWDALDEAFQENLKEHVAAVLQAIRVPSAGMIAAGIIERHESGVPEAWNKATANIYTAMIDAALA